MPRVQQSLQ
ncbi:unnamed protein product [Staurois parvus]|uniref:Uncharacterized protein n=1 Tax=Staurois parvus TaxID=386267 RepID=A0ABN9FFX9_9NEOB|nr:unnamed protein product [Staurois parvus]